MLSELISHKIIEDVGRSGHARPSLKSVAGRGRGSVVESVSLARSPLDSQDEH